MPNLKEELYNPQRVLSAIREYRLMDLRNQDLDSIIDHFKLIVNQFHLICANIGSVPLFRTRIIDNGNIHTNKKDVWCPPAACVKKMGRLNDVNESIFYAAFDPITAIKETRIKKGDKFSLAIYRIKERDAYNLSTINLGLPRPIDTLSEREQINTMILSDFMFSEFTRHVGLGTEYQYKASCAVSKLLFDIPHKDSIIYPSMIDYSKRNIALKEASAEERVELEQVLTCELNDYDSDLNPVLTMTQNGIYSKDSDLITYTKTPRNQMNFTLKLETFFKGFNPYEHLINKIDEYK